MVANVLAGGRVAVLAAALLGAAFVTALATPGAQSGPGAGQLAVGDRYMNGRVVALRWMADGARVVAVIRRGAKTSAVLVSPDASRRFVAVPVAGDLDVQPAPSGDRVAIVRTRANLRARVALVDVQAGHEDWWRWTPGPTRVRWRDDGAVVFIAAADACRVVRVEDGQTVRESPPSSPRTDC